MKVCAPSELLEIEVLGQGIRLNIVGNFSYFAHALHAFSAILDGLCQSVVLAYGLLLTTKVKAGHNTKLSEPISGQE